MSPGKAADEAAAPKVLDERSPSLLTWEKGPEAREFRAGHAAFLSKVKAGEHLAFKIPWLDIAFVFVPPGAFTMGDENGEEDELPETPMKITRGFWLGKFELSQEEWQLVMRSNLSRHKSPQRPVEMISWRGAVDFCKRLTERERQAGRLPRGYVYRLPTEAEWEYACRVGVEGRTPGVTPNTGWYAANAHQKTQPVGEKEANGLGVYDMFGNVAEWCYDWYGRYPGKPCNDYTGPSVGDFRVTRGGCSFDIAYGCRPAYRTGAEPISRSEGIGMRLALGPELPE
jgi:formylglycine-generating enzyme required for sulfatase activity